MVLAGCGEPNPYDVNDDMNYKVSIKFDANGGSFTGLDSYSPVIVDSYDISGLQANAEGKVELPLLTPDNESRADAATAVMPGHFLVGWYQERTESTDANGNTVYTYAKPWDFENGRVSVDPKAEHTSKEPVLTLYAAWAPMFEIEYYALGTDQPIKTVTIDPNQGVTFKVPAWNMETGAMDMNDFPEKEGYTFTAAYYDSEKTKPIDTETVLHPGIINRENATSENHKLKLYVDYKEGKWFKISTPDQLIDNASPAACYDLQADLDFTGKRWPTELMYGNYAGTLQGNGFAIRNVEIAQSNNQKMSAGLFGGLTEDASLQDVTFENITFTVEKGNQKQGSAFGLLAGTVSEKTTMQNVVITDSTLKILYSANLTAARVGPVSGYGNMGLDASGITCVAVNKEGAEIAITADELGFITVKFDINGNPVSEQGENAPEDNPDAAPEEDPEENFEEQPEVTPGENPEQSTVTPEE